MLIQTPLRMCMCICMCKRAQVGLKFQVFSHKDYLSMLMYICMFFVCAYAPLCACVYMRVCVCVRENVRRWVVNLK